MSPLLEELTDAQKKYVRSMFAQSGATTTDIPHDSTHDDFFERYAGDKNASRVVIPFARRVSYEDGNDLSNGFEYNLITKRLAKHGYIVHDYVNNIASQTIDTPFGKKVRTMKISKAIQRLPQEDQQLNARDISYHGLKVDNLGDLYSSSAHRKTSNTSEDNLQIVISRHRDDVAGMSTGREWESCMTLPETYDDNSKPTDSGGMNHRYLKQDFKHGTIAAYLTRKGDDSISAPIGRTLIKKFESDSGHSVYRPTYSDYGDINSSVGNVLDSMFKQHYPSKENETYRIHPDLYPDRDNAREVIHPEDEISMYLHQHTENLKNPKIVHHSLDEYGALHSDDNTPSVIIEHQSPYAGGEKLETHLFHVHGLLHSENNSPTKIIYKTGKDGSKEIIHQERHFFGMLHSSKDEEPSVESKDIGGTLKRSWHKYGYGYVSPMFNASSITARHSPEDKGTSTVNIDRSGSNHLKSAHITDPMDIKIKTSNGNTSIQKEYRGANFKTLTEHISYENGGLVHHSLVPPPHNILAFGFIPGWKNGEDKTVKLSDDVEYHPKKTYEEFVNMCDDLKRKHLELNDEEGKKSGRQNGTQVP